LGVFLFAIFIMDGQALILYTLSMDSQIIVNNYLISYFGIERGNARAVIFLHGWRSSKESWNRVMGHMLSSENIGHALYALDLPGFGKSQIPKRDFTVNDYADFVVEFIKKLELKNVSLVGHSFGGRVAIKLAAAHPELINSVVLVDSAGFVEKQSRKDIMGLISRAVKPLFKPQFMQPLRKAIYQALGAEDYVATPALQKTFVNVVNEDLTLEMEKIQSPCLIVWGSEDEDTPISYGHKMNTLIQGSRLVIIQDAGHFSFVDKPGQFGDALINFLKTF